MYARLCMIYWLLQGQNPEEKQLTQAQRALLGNIDAGLNAVNAAQNNLQNKGQVPDLGDDEVCRGRHGL